MPGYRTPVILSGLSDPQTLCDLLRQWEQMDAGVNSQSFRHLLKLFFWADSQIDEDPLPAAKLASAAGAATQPFVPDLITQSLCDSNILL